MESYIDGSGQQETSAVLFVPQGKENPRGTGAALHSHEQQTTIVVTISPRGDR